MKQLLFDPGQPYRLREIKAKFNLSERATAALLRGLPRIELTRRTILYMGSDLNDLVERRLRAAV